MSLQTIVDNAVTIGIDRKKIAAQSVSRSGRLLTAEVASAVPYRFTITIHEGLKWSENRGVVETIDSLDIVSESIIDIGGTNSGLGYITAYQGDLEPSQVNQLSMSSITSSTGGNIYINTNNVFPLGNLSGSSYLFRAGDIIQPGPDTYRYPYTVTEDVLWSASSSKRIPIHRNFIDQASYTETGKDIRVGSECQWHVKMLTKPSYNIVPYDRVVFNSDFELIEVIRKEDG